MGWVDKLRGTLVGLDTAPLIYFIERHPLYLPTVYPFFESVERGEIRVITSALTLTEALVHPIKHGDQRLADQYSRILLNSRNLTTIPVSLEIATEAAHLRAAYGLRTPDSIQLATARVGGATAFLSNDDRFAAVTGIQPILLDRLLNHP